MFKVWTLGSRYRYKGGGGISLSVHFPRASLLVHRSGTGPGLDIRTVYKFCTASESDKVRTVPITRP